MPSPARTFFIRTGEVSWLWVGLWGSVALPLLLYLVLFRASVGALAGLIGQCALMALFGFWRPPARAVGVGLLLTLTLLLAGALLEQALSRGVWVSSDKSGLFENVSQRLHERVSGVGFRSWSTGDAEAATLSFEARLAAGEPGWDWLRSHPGFRLEPIRGDEDRFTRVVAPEDTGDYLMRTFDLGRPIGGEVFRVVLELRDPNGPPRLTPRPEIDPGSPVGAQRCRGVALAAWAPGGGGRCLPVTLDREWTRYSLSWRVPETVASSVVRVLLSDFGGSTFDVRRVQLYLHRRGLGPLIPQGASLEVAWSEQLEGHSGYSFLPSETWEPHALDVTRRAGARDRLTATLRTGGGVVLETRNVQLHAPDGTPLSAAASSTRQTIIFGDPNLAGHTAAVLGLALLSLAPPLPAFGGALLSVAGVALTGSRAAWLGLLVGLLWVLSALLRLRRPRKASSTPIRTLIPVTLTLGGGVALLLAAARGPAWSPLEGSALRLLSLNEVTARTDIWAAAWEAFLAHPLRGLGSGGFSGYWAEHWALTRAGSGEAVQHAHNLWLELSASYGVFGLAAALVLTAGLPYVALRLGGAHSAALVGAVLAMNILDTTFFYIGVLLPLALALTAYRYRPGEPGGAQASTLQLPSPNRGIIEMGSAARKHATREDAPCTLSTRSL